MENGGKWKMENGKWKMLQPDIFRFPFSVFRFCRGKN